MVVYEVGIITEGGLPIITVNLRLEGQKADPALQAGFLTALQQFVSSTFSDETQSFIMRRYNIFLMKVRLDAENEEALVYAVGDKKASEKEVRKHLKVIGERVQEMFPSLHDPSISESQLMTEIKVLIEQEFEDLKQKPVERARKLFG
jgi:hypothetical protein